MKRRTKTCALCLLLMPATLAAQSPSPSPEIVKLNLIVTDASNRYVDDVKREDIQLSEEGTPQTITLFARNIKPIDYGIVLDTSGSFRELLQPSVVAAKLMVNSNRPDDKTFIVRFISTDKIETLIEFSSDKTALMKSLDGIRVEGGQSAVIDAVYVSAKYVADYSKDLQTRRRALVLITDGEDRRSHYKEKELTKLLRENDVQIFIIGIIHLLDNQGRIAITRKSPREAAEQFLTRLAHTTGGRVFFPKTHLEFVQAADQIVHDLHMQYIIGYVPVDAKRSDGFREVKVRVAPSPAGEKRIAITRPGYLIGSADSKDEKKEKKPN